MGETGDRVLVGQADRTPKLSRRDFLKLGGSGAVSFAVSGLLKPENIGLTEGNIPEFMKSGIGCIEFKAQSGYGRPQSSDFGTAQVYLETDTDLVIVTAEHLGKGFFWERINLQFPQSRGLRFISVDARLDAPAANASLAQKHTDKDWWVRSYTKASDIEKGIENPVRTIVLAKPKGMKERVTPLEYGVLIAPPDPQPGEKFAVGGFPAEKKGALTFTTLQYERMTKPTEIKNAGIPLMEFSGWADHGMSGGAIMRPDGKVVALLRGPGTKKGTVVGIPFAKYQPLEIIRSMLGK